MATILPYFTRQKGVGERMKSTHNSDVKIRCEPCRITSSVTRLPHETVRARSVCFAQERVLYTFMFANMFEVHVTKLKLSQVRSALFSTFTSRCARQQVTHYTSLRVNCSQRPPEQTEVCQRLPMDLGRAFHAQGIHSCSRLRVTSLDSHETSALRRP